MIARSLRGQVVEEQYLLQPEPLSELQASSQCSFVQTFRTQIAPRWYGRHKLRDGLLSGQVRSRSVAEEHPSLQLVPHAALKVRMPSVHHRLALVLQMARCSQIRLHESMHAQQCCLCSELCGQCAYLFCSVPTGLQDLIGSGTYYACTLVEAITGTATQDFNIRWHCS